MLRAMRVPMRPPNFAVLARDSEGIVAAAWFEQDGEDAWIKAIGVSVRWRGQRVGDELVQRVLSRMIERALEQGVSELFVGGAVHPENQNSRRLLERHQFELVEPGDDDEYEEWGRALPID